MELHQEDKNERSRRKTILVVDDDEVIHELYALFLKDEPVDLIHDYDGRDVPALLEKNKPDLVLLDIGIPGTDGRDICRRIKEDARTGDIPVIMATGNDEACIRDAEFEFGPDDFIPKPSSRSVIMQTLLKYLYADVKNRPETIGHRGSFRKT